MSMTAFAPIRTPVVDQLTALGVDIHHVPYGPAHVFGWCEHCSELTSVASYTVYPRDEPCTECCVNCVVSVADQAVTDSFGRSDCCTVEIGTVEAPKPTVVLGHEDHGDIEDATCSRHWRKAVGVVSWSDGSDHERRESFCRSCAWDVQEEAMATASFAPPVVSALSVSDRELVAA